LWCCAKLQGRHRAGDGSYGTQGWREDAALMQERLLKQLMEILKTHLQVCLDHLLLHRLLMGVQLSACACLCGC
jgi:hypothetical protein